LIDLDCVSILKLKWLEKVEVLVRHRLRNLGAF